MLDRRRSVAVRARGKVKTERCVLSAAAIKWTCNRRRRRSVRVYISAARVAVQAHANMRARPWQALAILILIGGVNAPACRELRPRRER
jgi:hypothetical protein